MVEEDIVSSLNVEKKYQFFQYLVVSKDPKKSSVSYWLASLGSNHRLSPL